ARLADGSKISLTQMTDYPWEGHIKVTLNDVATHRPISLHFRVPGWTEKPVVRVNGVKTDVLPEPGSYLEVHRTWSAGDRITLDFPMPVRLMQANPKITKLQNRVAIMRGPLVYCLELPKSEGGDDIFNNGVILPESIKLTPVHRPEFLGGVTVLKGKALTKEGKDAFLRTRGEPSHSVYNAAWRDGELYRPVTPVQSRLPEAGTVNVELIPYYAWANRGLAFMDVWVPLAR
ncbi:MAG: glycoside hydrolase family 127 protein, partial [Phycisphaeraceae bacterium]|nr:glycoside hydrolase family 127 protein [Phycisphaeraceae bacterium]